MRASLIANATAAFGETQQDARVSMTKDEVREEHIRAMARLDEDQVRAFKRINRAFREARFTNGSVKDAMERVYEEEASERTGIG